jgi:hypothetical protein
MKLQDTAEERVAVRLGRAMSAAAATLDEHHYAMLQSELLKELRENKVNWSSDPSLGETLSIVGMITAADILEEAIKYE